MLDIAVVDRSWWKFLSVIGEFCQRKVAANVEQPRLRRARVCLKTQPVTVETFEQGPWISLNRGGTRTRERHRGNLARWASVWLGARTNDEFKFASLPPRFRRVSLRRSSSRLARVYTGVLLHLQLQKPVPGFSNFSASCARDTWKALAPIPLSLDPFHAIEFARVRFPAAIRGPFYPSTMGQGIPFGETS